MRVFQGSESAKRNAGKKSALIEANGAFLYGFRH